MRHSPFTAVEDEDLSGRIVRDPHEQRRCRGGRESARRGRCPGQSWDPRRPAI